MEIIGCGGEERKKETERGGGEGGSPPCVRVLNPGFNQSQAGVGGKASMLNI